jgi:hypothetical protein
LKQFFSITVGIAPLLFGYIPMMFLRSTLLRTWKPD